MAIKPPKGLAPPRTSRRSGAAPAGRGKARSNQNVKPLLMEAAVEAAGRRGYQALRITDITDPVEVTRQAFYAHFRDKRHCLCEALDPRLAAIERLAAASEAGQAGEPGSDGDPNPLLERFSPGWNAEIVAAIDELLIEHFGSAEGTKGRLIESLAAELEQTDSLAGIRIGSLVKRARVPQGDFYRHFSGKRECFAVLYEERLEALLHAAQLHLAGLEGVDRPSPEDRLLALGAALESDPARARLLAIGEGELPVGADQHMSGARRGDLAKAIAELLAASGCVADTLLTGSLIEVVRHAVLAENLDDLTSKLLDAGSSIAARPMAARVVLAA